MSHDHPSSSSSSSIAYDPSLRDFIIAEGLGHPTDAGIINVSKMIVASFPSPSRGGKKMNIHGKSITVGSKDETAIHRYIEDYFPDEYCTIDYLLGVMSADKDLASRGIFKSLGRISAKATKTTYPIHANYHAMTFNDFYKAHVVPLMVDSDNIRDEYEKKLAEKDEKMLESTRVNRMLVSQLNENITLIDEMTQRCIAAEQECRRLEGTIRQLQGRLTLTESNNINGDKWYSYVFTPAECHDVIGMTFKGGSLNDKEKDFFTNIVPHQFTILLSYHDDRLPCQPYVYDKKPTWLDGIDRRYSVIQSGHRNQVGIIALNIHAYFIEVHTKNINGRYKLVDKSDNIDIFGI